MKPEADTNDPIPPNSIPGEPGGEDVAAARQRMDALLAAENAIISALSSESYAFLGSTRQRVDQ